VLCPEKNARIVRALQHICKKFLSLSHSAIRLLRATCKRRRTVMSLFAHASRCRHAKTEIATSSNLATKLDAGRTIEEDRAELFGFDFLVRNLLFTEKA
jgi:hypothetical protein